MFVIPISLPTVLAWLAWPTIILGALALLCVVYGAVTSVQSRPVPPKVPMHISAMAPPDMTDFQKAILFILGALIIGAVLLGLHYGSH